MSVAVSATAASSTGRSWHSSKVLILEYTASAWESAIAIYVTPTQDCYHSFAHTETGAHRE